MKAFLLAAGHGTRLRPLTDSIPKCLVPVQGVPMLEIWRQICLRFGIDEVLINAHAHADAVRAFVDARRDCNVRFRIVEEPVLLGSAGTLHANAEWVKGEQNFWIFYSDVLTNLNLAQMMNFHRQKRVTATLGVYPVAEPRHCGIVGVNDEGIIESFVEKPAQPCGNLAFSGVILARPELFRFVPIETPRDIGFHVLPQMIGHLAAFRVSEYLIDIGTIENYQLAQRQWPGLPKETNV